MNVIALCSMAAGHESCRNAREEVLVFATGVIPARPISFYGRPTVRSGPAQGNGVFPRNRAAGRDGVETTEIPTEQVKAAS